MSAAANNGEEEQVRFLPERRNRRARVVVVGAGVAGLSAARKLLPRLLEEAEKEKEEEGRRKENGKKKKLEEEDDDDEEEEDIEVVPLVVLEARDRVGGRVHTSTVRATRRLSSSERIRKCSGERKEQLESRLEGEIVEFPVDWGAAWVHGVGPIDASPATTEGGKDGPGSSDDVNPIMGLIREAASGSATSDDDDFFRRFGLDPISPHGNPWTRPEILHAPLDTPTKSGLKDDDDGTARLCAFFVGGDRLDPDDPAVPESLLLHSAVMKAVSRVGNAAYEEGRGESTSRISAGRTIDFVRRSAAGEEGPPGDDDDKDGSGDEEEEGPRISPFLAYRHRTRSAKGATRSTPQSTSSIMDSDDEAQSSSADGEADGSLVETLVSYYHHLHECWHPHSLSRVQLSEYVNEEGESDGGNDGDYPGPHCKVKAGMASVLRPLLESNGVSERVLCGQEVTAIERAAHPPGSETDEDDEDDDDGVVVLCKSGVFVEADVCIVTMPLGCLQDAIQVPYNRSRGMFFPQLSGKKLASIQALSMGMYKKVFLTFDSIFWPTREPFLALIREVESEPQSLGGQTDDADAYDYRRRRHPPSGLGNHLRLENLWARSGLPCLQATLVGDAAAWATGLTDDAVRNAVLRFMEDAMANSVPGDVLPLADRCVSCRVTRWEEDRLSRGAYSGFVLGTEDRHAEELNRPEWDGRLLLAGEANVAEFEGSVHGALLSGEEAAEKALKTLGL